MAEMTAAPAIPTLQIDETHRPWSHGRQGILFGTVLAAPVDLALCATGVVVHGAWLSVPLALVSIAAAITLGMRYHRVFNAHRELEGVRTDLHHKMQHDALTGLLNRSAFQEKLDGLANTGNESVAIVFFDLDRFKDVNDSLGHRTGDVLLQEVAQRCRPVLEDAIAFARLSGDEFAAILPLDRQRPPESYGQEIVKAVREPFHIDGKIVDVGASVGLAIGHPAHDGGFELLRRADIAMYEAKAAGRGTCRIFDDVLHDRQAKKGSIRVELSNAISANELSMVYQPVINARTGLMSSVEALLRWRSGQIGDISPSTLIPTAEESGQIMQLTEWTLDKTLAAIARLPDLNVAVNISPIYFRHPEFVHRIFDRLIATKARPEQLTLEITEGVLMTNLETTKVAVSRLRDIGVKVYLDDFGTGYSSLSYLQHLPLDGLKLDKSFLRDVGEKRRATQIIRTMIDFGHSLDMVVVAEGIESEWQARLLQLLGCDFLQGYELGLPSTLEEIETALRESRQFLAADEGAAERKAAGEPWLKLVNE